MSASTASEYAEQYAAGITADMEREAPFGYVNQYDGTTAATLDEIEGYDADEHDADNLPENWEKAGAWDFLRDVLDIRYVVERDHSFRDAEICVGLGGPNVWIHTATSEVVVHWGFDSARVHLPSSFTDALKDAAEEDWG